MVGLVLGHTSLVSVYQDAPSMRSTTAVALVACGLSLVPASFVSIRRNVRLFLQSTAAMIGAIIMVVALFAWVGNVAVDHSRILDPSLFVPSMGTILAIGLFSSSMVYRATAFLTGANCIASVWAGLTVAIIGAVGVVGHLAGVPWMYWTFRGLSVGMAAHTAAAVLALGCGLLILPRPPRNEAIQ